MGGLVALFVVLLCLCVRWVPGSVLGTGERAVSVRDCAFDSVVLWHQPCVRRVPHHLLHSEARWSVILADFKCGNSHSEWSQEWGVAVLPSSE